MRTITVLLPALLALALPAHGQVEDPATHFMEQWDADGDGKVTLDEARNKRGEVFYMFDSDGDGTLNAGEWALVAEHMQAEMAAKAEDRPGKGQGKGQGQGKGHAQGQGAGKNGPGPAMHEAMSPGFNDADGDGTVTQTEFVAATDRLFTTLDRNGDGVVSAADFAR